jgi:hypothetical protein
MRGLLDFHSVQWKSTDSSAFSIFTIKKKRNPFVVKVNHFTTKFKSVFDSHYQMHIRLTHSCQLTFIERCGSQADLSFTWYLQVSVVPLTVRWFLEDFSLSFIFNTVGFVHSACISVSVVSGATRLESMYKLSRSVFPVTEPHYAR